MVETSEFEPRQADELLASVIFIDCSGVKVDALWCSIPEFVSGAQPVVPIFTLNYDWTFEKLAIENAQRYRPAGRLRRIARVCRRRTGA